MKKILLMSLATALVLSFSSCNNDDPDPVVEVTNTVVKMNFNHFVDGAPVEIDTMKYINTNGDTFSMRTIKYFITRVTFHRDGKSDVMLGDMHYVEHALPETESYTFESKIPDGTYTGVSFTYGFTNTDNISYMFDTPPEFQMFWPENMGGGYHYQKIEGQYLHDGVKKFFNFHAGGLDKTDYSIKITLPNSDFTVTNNEVNIELDMEIQNWFKNPVVWDFDYFGAAIMGNHEAQATIQKNGADVFSATVN
jgi:hypothetical protein